MKLSCLCMYGRRLEYGMMAGRLYCFIYTSQYRFYSSVAFLDDTQDGYNTAVGYSDGFGAREKGGNRNINRVFHLCHSIIFYVYDGCNNRGMNYRTSSLSCSVMLVMGLTSGRHCVDAKTLQSSFTSNLYVQKE